MSARARLGRGAQGGALSALALAALALLACASGDAPHDAASCKASKQCREVGKCTWEFTRSGCVVGSNADCEGAAVCSKDGRCKKVGDTCDR